jgi:hypothetical protein
MTSWAAQEISLVRRICRTLNWPIWFIVYMYALKRRGGAAAVFPPWAIFFLTPCSRFHSPSPASARRSPLHCQHLHLHPRLATCSSAAFPVGVQPPPASPLPVPLPMPTSSPRLDPPPVLEGPEPKTAALIILHNHQDEPPLFLRWRLVPTTLSYCCDCHLLWREWRCYLISIKYPICDTFVWLCVEDALHAFLLALFASSICLFMIMFTYIYTIYARLISHLGTWTTNCWTSRLGWSNWSTSLMTNHD